MNGFVPDRNLLTRISSLITNIGVDNSDRELLGLMDTEPNLSSLLLYIVLSRDQTTAVRQTACVFLKNTIKKKYYYLSPELKELIQENILNAMIDQDANIRLSAAAVITTIIGIDKQPWSNLFNAIHQVLSSVNVSITDFASTDNTPREQLGGVNAAIDGVSYTLKLICEDHPLMLIDEKYGRPILVFMPGVYKLLHHPITLFRARGIECINSLVDVMSPAVAAVWKTLKEHIFFLTNDPSPLIKREICRCFSLLTTQMDDLVVDYIEPIVKFNLECSKSSDDSLCLEACELWRTLSEEDDKLLCVKYVTPILDQLLPILFEKCIYSKDQLNFIEQEKEAVRSSTIRKQEIHPSKFNKHAVSLNMDDDEDDDDDDDELSQWCLRRCCALTIDNMSLIYGDALLPVLLPLIQERFQLACAVQRWPELEVGVLAAGALAVGCAGGLEPHAEMICQFLLKLLGYAGDSKGSSHPESMIRQITCWTLSRFIRTIANANPETKLLRNTIHALLDGMLDEYPRVQETACGSLYEFIDCLDGEIAPFITPIVNCLKICFGRYDDKRKLDLLEVANVLFPHYNDLSNQDGAAQTLLQSLINEWKRIGDDDDMITPLFFCFGSIATAMQTNFKPLALETYQRSLRIIEKGLAQFKIYYSAHNIKYPDKRPTVAAFNLISSLAESLDKDVANVILDSSNNQKTQENMIIGSNGEARNRIVTTILTAIQINEPELRQTSTGLIGDLVQREPKLLLPEINQIVRLLLPLLDADTYVSVCNNSCWSIGEIAVVTPQEQIAEYIPEIITRIINCLNRGRLYRTLDENLAITIGRIGLHHTQAVAARLNEFLKQYFTSMKLVVEDVEKHSSFEGICKAIAANPQGSLEFFPYLCEAVSGYANPPQPLAQSFYQLLNGFKSMIGPNWSSYYAQFPEKIKEGLERLYNFK